MTRKVITYDAETFRFKPGRAVPRFVVLGWKKVNGEQVDKGILCHYMDSFYPTMRDLFELALEEDYILSNHNMAFDMSVVANHEPRLLPLIFELYQKERVECTYINEQMLDNAAGFLNLNFKKKGYYSLAGIAKRKFDVDLDKTTWRLGYSKLWGVPLEEYPQGAKDYVLADVDWADMLQEEQMRQVAEDDLDQIPNARFQTKVAFAFQLMSAWGIRTNGLRLLKLEKDLTAEMEKLRALCVEKGFIRPNGTKNMKVIRDYIEAHVKNPQKTKKGQISTDADALAVAGVKELSEFNHIQKDLGTYVKAMKDGVKYPINPGWRTLVESGRASGFKPNLMNLPRFPGVRECFVPRPGYVFCSVDYDTLELRTLAQSCLWMVGFSKLAEAINAGLDPHVDFAASLLGIPYEEAQTRYKAGDEEVKYYRTLAKVANFGFPGGLGAETFVSYALGYGVILDLQKSTELRNNWFQKWPEMKHYFQCINGMLGPANQGTAILPGTNFTRGRVGFTACANFFFQSLAATGAKEAVFNIAQACYVPGTVLFGSRLNVFVHDETIMEHPDDDTTHDRAMLQAKIMCDSMQKYTPEVIVTATPALMRCWYKDAKDVYDNNGRLVPWEPKEKAA